METIERFDNQIARTIDEVEDLFDFLELEKGVPCFTYDYNVTLPSAQNRTESLNHN